MSRSLIIVESPTKVRTLKKFLGKDFEIKASSGHVKDLPKNGLGVDLKNDFQPEYVLIPGKKKILDEILQASRKATAIYLAPDPDREGEAIAWHIAEALKVDPEIVYRAEFNEITKSAVLKAIKNPRRLNSDRYEAQKARRVLDRLVGYELSPLLWEKVKRGLSAGRVQSVAVRIVCDRENQVQEFKPAEHWRIEVELQGPSGPPFPARLVKIEGKPAEISNQSGAEEICAYLKNAVFQVSEVESKERQKNPPPPFITSTIQQEAYRRLNFPVKKTMFLAQQLYEGVELNAEGPVGLITYLRTDSVRVAQEALDAVRLFIRDQYGPQYLPPQPNLFRSRRGAQEAHEAIRPTSLEYVPEKIESQLSPDLFRLYQLIWNRFLASQFSPAIYDTIAIDIQALNGSAGPKKFSLRASGSTLRFPGFLSVYRDLEEEEKEEQAPEEKSEPGILPPLSPHAALVPKNISPSQHFTAPPPRFTEASLVRELEENGIGRPSTYATILSQIQEKNYIKKIKGKFYPTELGKLVNVLLVKSFPDILDLEFTAEMEEKLDQIESGREKWTEVLKNFFTPFQESLKRAKSEMRKVRGATTPTDVVCDVCGKPMVIRWGRNGEFLSCSGYPSCRNTKNFTRGESGQIQPLARESSAKSIPESGITCSQCGRPMVIKRGRYGEFLACSGYPQCKNTLPLGKDLPCPAEGCSGTLVQRRGKGRRFFYGCSRYPECRFILRGSLVRESCPQCQAPFLVQENDEIKCIRTGCHYSRSASESLETSPPAPG